jgi:hypothetical protein
MERLLRYHHNEKERKGAIMHLREETTDRMRLSGTTIWKKQKDGQWKIAASMGNSNPAPKTEK